MHHFAPWARRIYLAAPAGHRLRLELFAAELRAKVQVVEEQEFVPPEFLPTFNSIVSSSGAWVWLVCGERKGRS